MRRYILGRILLGIVTLIGVSMIIFSVSRLTGDVTLLLAPPNATDQEIQEVRAQYGLDKPIPVQYYIFVRDALHGDFGTSITYHRPAMQLMLERLPNTLLLGMLAFILSNIVGISLGVFTATRRRKWFDQGGKIFALLGQATPNFWLAVILILVFAVKLHWLPTSGMGGIKNLVLPTISLSFFPIAYIMRITRSSMLDVVDSEYIKMARIKGNPESIVIWKHAMRNALIPVVTMAGMQMAMLLGGMAIIEQVYRWPGVGSLMVNSITGRDYPVVQAITMITSSAVVFINLVVDILFVYIDPRIKYD